MTASPTIDVLPGNIWFTSDLHLGHANIIKYCKRPFEDVYHMDNVLIAKWNARVRPNDLVFVVGDFSLANNAKVIRSYRERLAGHIVLVRGNHDSRKGFSYFDDVFDFVRVRVSIAIGAGHQLIVLCHYGLDVWENSHHGTWHLHGHSHGTLPPGKRRRLDVGVDCHNYQPLSYFEVAALLENRPFEPVDGHKDRR